MQISIFNKIIWAFYYIFIFFFLLNNSLNYLDPDLGWHLKVGEEIAKFKEVPHIEHFDFSLEGKRWVDHEWLANFITYIIYNNFGYISLNIFFALIVVLTLFVLNKFTQKHFLKSGQKGIFFIITLQFLGVVAMLPHLGVRIQEITVLFFLLLLIMIYNFAKHKKQSLQQLLQLFFLSLV